MKIKKIFCKKFVFVKKESEERKFNFSPRRNFRYEKYQFIAWRRSAIMSSAFSYTDREAYQVGGLAGFDKLFVAELTMSMAGWVQHASARVGHMGNDGGKFQAVHKPDCVFPRTFETEGNDAASTVRHVFLSQSVVFVVFQSRIIYPSDLWGNFRGIRRLSAHFRSGEPYADEGFRGRG